MTDQDNNRADNASDGGVRQRAIEAYDEARDSVAQAGRKANDAIDEAPLIALAGGLAVGAILAALLPRTESETRVLRPVGDKLTGTAKAAAAAAKDAGKSRLAELGLTREKGAETLRSIFEDASEAAKTSAQAALSGARERE
ncbi:hypothetical protein [Sphingomonas sp.]|uniref:hypothetical protein n=1 Tax=Sphingomonas sp. TaxID=28214 RepID=UPI0018176BB0|nr:hypothetical protein [Sphingomonas sp.]MBA3510664.1 hypothetical protein [Sphingomonas sp.]